MPCAPTPMKKIIAFLLIITYVCTASRAGEAADSVKAYFRFGHSRFEPERSANHAEIRRFINMVRQQDSIGNIDRIIIISHTSPDGVITANAALSSRRSIALKAYIISATGIDRRLVDTVPGGIAWHQLRQMIAVDSRVPAREEALRILDNTPVWVFDHDHNVSGSRKKSLMELNGGDTYRWLRDHCFDELNKAVAVLYVKDIRRAHRHTYHAAPAMRAYPVASAPPAGHMASRPLRPAKKNEAAHRFALKTNLLYALALMPSLELEFRLGRYLSLGIEGAIAWWKQRLRHKCYQLACAGPELRVWFRGRSMQRGLYAGTFAAAGLYDLENVTNGYRGEGAMAGLSLGYVWPVSRHISLEAAVGAGWLRAKYKEYTPFEDHHIYLRSRTTDYFGPLKVKFAIAWRFGRIEKGAEP